MDIDAYGFGITDAFSYVRLTDDVTQWPATNRYDFYAGPDIDAVGAISTTPVPEPATVVLLGLGAIPAVLRHRRRG